MSVPISEDEGLVGDPSNLVRGFINFEGETLDDCLRAIGQAVDRITDGHTMGANYLRDDTHETGFYRFEVE